MRKVISKFESPVFSLPDAVWDKISTVLVTRSYASGSVLLSEGDISDKLYFIEDGIARSFYESNGQEYTTWFARNKQFACSVRSFFRQVPSFETIQLLTDAKVSCVSYSDIQLGLATLPEVSQLMRLLTEQYVLQYESQARVFRSLNARQRLDHFVKHNPEIYREVALKDIATYLDMDPCTLSRLRAERDS